MMLQPIVENAIVHGLVKKDVENKIDIHFTKLPYFLRCRISDNGIGSFNIEDLYDDKGKPSGTAVTLMIPLDFKSREK